MCTKTNSHSLALARFLLVTLLLAPLLAQAKTVLIGTPLDNGNRAY